MVVARKRFIPQQKFTLIPSFSVTPIHLSPAVRSTLELLPIGWDAIFFSTFVRMRRVNALYMRHNCIQFTEKKQQLLKFDFSAQIFNIMYLTIQ